MNESSPCYSKHACEKCGGHIEFDESLLNPGEETTVNCPHCGAKMTVSRPDPFVESANSVLSSFLGASGPNERTDFVVQAMKGTRHGDPKSMQLLALAYYVGMASKKDPVEAAKLMYRAAVAGDAQAQFNLGSMYHWGSVVGKDPFQAFAWWLKAAEQGHSIAQNNVGYSYDTGEVVQQDYVEAYKWMTLAASSDHAGAQEHCNEIAAKMTREQQEESLERVHEFCSSLDEKPAPPRSWWDETMAERERKAEFQVAAIKSAALEPRYQRCPIPTSVRVKVWERDEGRCMKCGSRQKIHIDHIIPISKGGSDTVENLELLCQVCNLAKGARIV